MRRFIQVHRHIRARVAALGLLALGLLLAGCMLMPGRFVSDLTVRRDGTFAFHYKGEIVMLALSPQARGKSAAAALPDQADEQVAVFEERPCSDARSGDPRPCTRDEIDAQRTAWAANRADTGKGAGKAADADGEKAMRALLGGIDPSDPRAAQEFADRLARQQGWKSVINKGNGKFEVDYEIAGRLDHDFTFPTIERLPMVMPFVAVIRRADGTVRIDAPAFANTGGNGNPFASLGALAALGNADKKQATPAAQQFPVLDGTFIVRSDGQVLANNTDEGPQADPAGGQRLVWKVDARTAAAPTALLRLGR